MLELKRGSAELKNLIRYMQEELASAEGDQQFLKFSRSIVASVPYDSNNQLGTVLDFVRNNVRYQPDPAGTELFTSPHKMMELVQSGTAAGDCDDYAIFCTAICRALGYTSHIVLLDQGGNGYNHAACEVESDSLHEMLYMDPTLPEGPLGIASPRKSNDPGSAFGLSPHYVHKLVVS